MARSYGVRRVADLIVVDAALEALRRAADQADANIREDVRTRNGSEVSELERAAMVALASSIAAFRSRLYDPSLDAVLGSIVKQAASLIDTKDRRQT